MKWIGVSLVFCFALLTVLYVVSDIGNDRRGTFRRMFIAHPFIDSARTFYPLTSHKVIGRSNSSTYLWNRHQPFKILQFQDSQPSPRQFDIDLDRDSVPFFNIDVRVDSPYFFLADGSVPYIYRGNVNDWQGKRFMYDSTFFLDIEPIGKSSFILRSMSRLFERTVLMKQFNEEPFVTVNHNILEKQIDGYFCTQGMMDYNEDINRVIYVYFYRNQYLVIDTVLNLIAKNNTIDTVSRAQIETVALQRNASTAHRLSAPPRVVNESIETDGAYLFIHSTTAAANENIDRFNSKYVLDVYDLEDSQYKFSFYIDHHEKSIEDFKVVDDHLFVVSSRGLYQYTLDPEYFNTKENINRD